MSALSGLLAISIVSIVLAPVVLARQIETMGWVEATSRVAGWGLKRVSVRH